MTKKVDVSKPVEVSPTARGKRVKQARLFAGLTQREMEDKHDISVNTQQSWENGKKGGLTPKGAMRIVYALREEGVYVTKEYLLDGRGLGPQRLETVIYASEPTEKNSEVDDETAIRHELTAFRKYNPNAIDMRIIDDGMSPQYVIGEYIGGQRFFGSQMVQCINYDCIVETIDGEYLFRRLKAGQRSDTYTLYCTNPDTQVLKPVLYDVELKSVAPAIWIRRRRRR